MDLRLLRTFATVARTGNVSAAAVELSTSQPAVTKQLQLLERRVGATLFVRGRQGARLTAAGEALLPDALDLLSRSEAFERRAASVAAGEDGSLAIGFGLSGIELAPRAVALFRSRYPGVAVSLDDMSSAVQCERLLAGTLQIGFVRLPAPAGIDHVRLRKDRLALALPATIDVPANIPAWLDGRPLVRLRPVRGPGLSHQITTLYAELGCTPLILQEADDLLTVLALVAAGVGPAVVPASAGTIASDGVRLVPLRGKSACWWIGAAWVERSLVLDRFLTAATDAARS
ncbi:transcriptional regulator, LysR family [Kribbella flavida DSM 17836]|uniref:Transcriptional regulator, LysR family n=1 Tax=Kribbella flavida (strain DSM 17836 / JCM 10339 / NBRC 14399) TaxID=479435 RepID=D2Q1D9_KRIFD|nr:LysR family transcriptional regulator [Kribbella flavida]ADB30127.1 transcriptional regulator, LysR family [Kribbella flavida DSM 17836]